MSATDIVINFLGNTSGLNAASGQAATGMEKFKSRVNKASLAIVGAAAVMGAKAVEIASDTSESASKVQTLFGKSAKSITAFADTSAKSYGMSKLEALNAVGAMGAVQIAMGVGAKQAAKLSVKYVKLSADLASFNNASSAEVQEALTASLSGEYEMLKKYGIVVNDVTLSAEAQRIGMKKTGATWDSAQKQQLSYNIIMASTQKAQGDFARTSGGLANQTKILHAQMSDLQGELGAKLLPVVVKVANALNGAFDLMREHQTTTKILAVTIGTIAAAAVTLSVGMRLVAVATALNSAAWTAFATVMWANPIFLIAGLVVALSAALVIAYKRSETFRAIVDTTFKAVRTIIVTALQALSTIVLGFWGVMIDGAAKALGWVPGIGGKLKAAAKKFDEFKDSVNASLANIKNPPPVHIAVNVDNVYAKLKAAGVPNAAQAAKNQAMSLDGRATGGTVSANRTYVVGERGPELFTSSTSGRITPNDELMGGGPDTLALTLDLGEGIRQVVEIKLRERDRGLRRTDYARGRRA